MLSVGFEKQTLPVIILIGLTVGILMLSLPLAGFLCRKKFGPVKFSLWTAFWVLFMTTVFFMGVVVVQALIYSSLPFSQIIGQVLIFSSVYAAVLIAGLLPFEILLFSNTFWWKRFERIFGLNSFKQSKSQHQLETPMDIGSSPA
jgi:hypothetical protein